MAPVRAYGVSGGEDIAQITPGELAAEHFPAGSMGPKIEVACRFVEFTGRTAAIGTLDQAPEIVRGHVGTRIRRSARGETAA